MSKTKARARKKARLAKSHADKKAGISTAAPAKEETATHPGKFDAKAPPGAGGVNSGGGKNIPNPAASRGSARSR